MAEIPIFDGFLFFLGVVLKIYSPFPLKLTKKYISSIGIKFLCYNSVNFIFMFFKEYYQEKYKNLTTIGKTIEIINKVNTKIKLIAQKIIISSLILKITNCSNK